MCDFISWIEVEKDGEKHLLFLTDKEVFDDPHGREKLDKCQDNDFIGHGAIRAYYGLADGVGEECEVREFWRKDALPEPLATMVKDFDRHWGRMFSRGVFQDDDLGYIIMNAPRSWSRKAWNQLKRQRPAAYVILGIIAFSRRAIAREVREYFFSRCRSQQDFMLAIRESSSHSVVNAAWARLLELGPSRANLLELCLTGDFGISRKAWDALVKMGPSKRECRRVMFDGYSDDISLSAAKHLIEHWPTIDTLITVYELYLGMPLYRSAMQKLFSQARSHRELRMLVSSSYMEISHKASKMLLADNPTRADLRYIMRHGFSQSVEAAAAAAALGK